MGRSRACATRAARLAARVAQAEAPIRRCSVWTFDNPSQRPLAAQARQPVRGEEPQLKVDFQWFTFADLGKKVSVGYATGTAPDGFVTGDWLMRRGWPQPDRAARLKLLGYASLDGFRKDHADAFVAGAIKDGQAYGYPLWFYGFCNYLNTNSSRRSASIP